MKLKNILILLFSLAISALSAQDGYRIEVDIEGFEGEELYLGYYLMDKQYIQDTVYRTAEGNYIFEGEEPLKPGMYLVVLPPDNNFFQLIVNKEEQQMRVQSNLADLNADIQFEGSEDNSLLYNYINTLSQLRPQAEQLGQKVQSLPANSPDRKQVEQELEQINQKVMAMQKEVVEEHPQSMTAAIIKANQQVEVPEFEGDPKDVQMKQYLYMREHYFDNIDMQDERLLRSPFLYQKVDFFVNKYHLQHPDTLCQAIQKVLGLMEGTEETFQFYVSHFLNQYAKSKLVGMDGVYVCLVDNYYGAGKTPWVEEEQLKKIVDNGNKLKPLLIGKIAPDFRVEKKDGTQTSLHEVDSDITVLYFWRYDCGHCKESTPFLKEFYENYKDKGIEIFAVCVKFTDEVSGCWDYIEENGISDWIHTVDPYLRSKFTTLYDIQSTPQIYILDEKKEILSKKIGAEQLGEVIDKIIEMRGE
jgi:thiol-disulfide isomerase/thioredoxin